MSKKNAQAVLGADTQVGWSVGGTVERRVEAWEDLILVHMMCVCVCLCVCVFMQRERERERDGHIRVIYIRTCVYTYMNLHAHKYILHTYIRIHT